MDLRQLYLGLCRLPVAGRHPGAIIRSKKNPARCGIYLGGGFGVNRFSSRNPGDLGERYISRTHCRALFIGGGSRPHVSGSSRGDRTMVPGRPVGAAECSIQHRPHAGGRSRAASGRYCYGDLGVAGVLLHVRALGHSFFLDLVVVRQG